MATLVFTAVGALVGGPIGGLIGAFAGQQVDAKLFGPKPAEGPRLKDLSIQTSSYGAPLPRHYGRMRTAGSVIWATELKESREKSGGGKGRPKVVTYSYSSSFAVALGSRPVRDIGRIWADGNLLRGAAGDLKVTGSLRLHRGHADQDVDPLIAAAEGSARCPAFRSLAYCVIEDLALADFGNRVPSLTIEVFADDGSVSLARILGDAVPEAAVAGITTTVAGYTIDSGTAAALVEGLSATAPLACMSGPDRLAIAEIAADAADPTLTPEPLAVAAREGEARRPALQLRSEPLPVQRDLALRYYDVDRDYQPGLQRAAGRSRGGEPVTVDFPAALDATGAGALATMLAAVRATGRETATIRLASAARRLAPGSRVRLSRTAGVWLVESWELDDKGVELALRRVRAQAGAAPLPTDPGRANPPPDLIAGPSVIAAFELPWDGSGSASERRLFAAVSSASAGWTGAALFALRADGSLDPLGGSGRVRATMGQVAQPLGDAAATLLDTANAIEVQLVGTDLALESATLAQLALGSNRALLGSELLQFGGAEALGAGRWRLHSLLRGRGGTEWAIGSHGPDETFVLLDAALVPLDTDIVGEAPDQRIAALGIADSVPVDAPITLAGSARAPLTPVHGTVTRTADGGLALTWLRRARGAWVWRDAIDVPVVEQGESYLVAFEAGGVPLAQWVTGESRLAVAPAQADALRTQASGGVFTVRQRGDYGLSLPLTLVLRTA